MGSLPLSNGSAMVEAVMAADALGPVGPEDFETLEQALDLLKQMLTWNPANRISAAGALAHPFLASLHCEEDEPACLPLGESLFAFERAIADASSASGATPSSVARIANGNCDKPVSAVA